MLKICHHRWLTAFVEARTTAVWRCRRAFKPPLLIVEAVAVAASVQLLLRPKTTAVRHFFQPFRPPLLVNEAVAVAAIKTKTTAARRCCNVWRLADCWSCPSPPVDSCRPCPALMLTMNHYGSCWLNVACCLSLFVFIIVAVVFPSLFDVVTAWISFIENSRRERRAYDSFQATSNETMQNTVVVAIWPLEIDNTVIIHYTIYGYIYTVSATVD